MQRLSDRDFTVWIKNMGLAIGREAQRRGITIDIYAEPDGYVKVSFDDYEYLEFGDSAGYYSYQPLGKVDEWQHHLEPAQIYIGSEPKEKSPEPTKAIRA